MEQLEGVISQIIYRNEENGYTVLELEHNHQARTAVGVFPALVVGEPVLLHGNWVEHPDYGAQFKAQLCEALRPTATKDIERYLASGIISGIGPATARLLVERFGAETFAVLDSGHERILEIPGIGKKRAKQIWASWQEQSAMRVCMLFLQKHGLTPALALRIYKAYGERAVAKIQENPYALVADVFGVGFQTADRIAQSVGISSESPFRLQAGLVYVLQQAAGANGHVYLPQPLLLRESAALLGAPEQALEPLLEGLSLEGKLMRLAYPDHAAVYLPVFAKAEAEAAVRLHALCGNSAPACEPEALEREFFLYERERDLTLADAQKQAVRQAVSGGALVITGGPGTGKTTALDCILWVLARRNAHVLLAAPTGRAAKRMAEATGYAAQTLHRLLEYGGGEDTAFTRDEDNPLEGDVLIIDEMSMVDILLMRAALRAVPPGMRLILVGDENQLPSVGAGQVLRDIIASEKVPVVRLVEIFRQARESQIVLSAHRINAGEIPLYNQKGGDFFFEKQAVPRLAADAIVELVARRLPRYASCDALRIQVLSPTKKGEAGVFTLNERLQEALNPPAPGKGEVRYGATTFRAGDKVMQVRNNYQAEWTSDGEDGQGVFNGDMGIVTDVDVDNRLLTVLFDDDRTVEYTASMLEDLELAYCTTIHKSQGSEFPVVVIPVVGGPPQLMTRNLLYTAVTRAKNLVVLVGREAVAQAMIENQHVARRYSALAHRLGLLAQLDARLSAMQGIKTDEEDAE